MFFFKNTHKFIIKFIIIIFFVSCQLKEPTKNHGIIFLKNRSELLTINKSNKNDVIRNIGQPHTLSTFNENEWIYFERVLTKGEFLKLGSNVLKTNNVLVLKFNKYGILENKVFLDKKSKNELKFSENETTNDITKKSFIEKFLNSLRSKMYKK